jgi:hypothetical protein
VILVRAARTGGLALLLRPGVFRVFSTGYFKTEYVTPVVFYPV